VRSNNLGQHFFAISGFGFLDLVRIYQGSPPSKLLWAHAQRCARDFGGSTCASQKPDCCSLDRVSHFDSGCVPNIPNIFHLRNAACAAKQMATGGGMILGQPYLLAVMFWIAGVTLGTSTVCWNQLERNSDLDNQTFV